MPNVHTVTARYKGRINIRLGKNTNLTLGNIYFRPELKPKLMSYNCLERSKFTIKKSGEYLKFYQITDGDKLLRVMPIKSSYELFMVSLIQRLQNRLQMNVVRSSMKGRNDTAKNFIDAVWPKLLGHINHKVTIGM